MSQIYKTKDGDMLDSICRDYYGASSGYVEQVLTANPGLAELGPVYDAGVEIILPDVSTTSNTSARVSLWA